MQALILAGGLGTRLRNVVKDRPKPMAIIGGKPFLEYQIELLKKNGVKDIILSTGYMSEKVVEYFHSGEKHGVSIKYVKEEDLLGTGGAIKNAKDILDEQFLALNGDSIFLVDIQSMIKFHRDNQADLTISLAGVKEKSKFGNVKTNDNSQITEFIEKGDSPTGLINGGIYYFEKDNFDWQSFPDKFSIEKDFFPQVIKNKRVFGFVSDSYFIDIGTEEDYEKFAKVLSDGMMKF
ncbi:MAG: nucleotidyltransferase family protein [Patescibacteria group bacterium]|nr:nucleotidyltransferase family protein [Patescibacteria group bacterium]